MDEYRFHCGHCVASRFHDLLAGDQPGRDQLLCTASRPTLVIAAAGLPDKWAWLALFEGGRQNCSSMIDNVTELLKNISDALWWHCSFYASAFDVAGILQVENCSALGNDLNGWLRGTLLLNLRLYRPGGMDEEEFGKTDLWRGGQLQHSRDYRLFVDYRWRKISKISRKNAKSCAVNSGFSFMALHATLHSNRDFSCWLLVQRSHLFDAAYQTTKTMAKSGDFWLIVITWLHDYIYAGRLL